jgi:ParB-like chromosome segregation protein Spo0J
MDIKLIKPNPDNPRVITKDKFSKLVESIKSFPEMLELRPIVVNSDNVVLGGNMRLKACIEAGLTDVPVVIAKDLTEDQELEFIIKDNVGFGEWDWDDLANNWDEANLKQWGLDIPKFEEETVNDADENNYIKISVECTDTAFIELGEKLQNLCEEYSAIMKVK